MANPDLTLVFGAKIDELIKAVDQVKAKVEELNSTTQKSTEGFNSLSNVIKTVFSAAVVTAIEQIIVKLAELGLRTEKTMMTLGLTADATVQLSAMAMLAGISTESLTLAMGRLYLNVQRSTRDAFTPAALAMNVLHLHASDLTKSGGDASNMIETLHKTISGFNPSMNLFAAVEALAGRNVANLIPLLIKSDEEWKKVKQDVDAAQKGLAAAIPGMAETHAKITLMELALGSLAARIFNVFKPAIDKVITTVADLAKSITSEDIRKGVLAVGNWLINFGTALAKFFIDLKATIDKFVAGMNSSLASISIEPGSIADVLITKVMGPVTAAEMRSNPAKDKIDAINDAAKKSKTSIDEMGASLRTSLTLSMGGGGGHGAGAGGPAGTKENAGLMNFGGAEAMQAGKIALEGTIKLMEEYYKGQQEKYTADVAAYRISELDKNAALITALKGNQAFELDTVNVLERYYARNAADKARYEAQKAKIVADTALKIQKLEDDSYKYVQKQVEGYVNNIQSSWDSSLRGILAGTTKFKDAMTKVFADLIIYMIQQIEKKFIFEKATLLLTDSLYKLFGASQVATAAETEGAKTGIAEAGAAARIGSSIAEAMSAIGTAVAVVFVKLAAFFSSLGPVGIAMAAGAAAGVAAVATGMIKKFDVGTNYVASSGLAMIHKGEAIVPAAGTGPFTGGMGAPPVTVNVTNHGPMSTHQLNQQARQIAKAVADAWRFNPSMRPAY